MLIPQPTIMEGNVFTDDRGTVSFVNGFDFKDVKRFYSESGENFMEDDTHWTTLPDEPKIFVPDRLKRANFVWLEINHEHTLAVAKLPLIHKDPFDRLLSR